MKCFSIKMLRPKIIGFFAGISLLLIQGTVQAQILRDSASLRLVKQAIGSIYNLKFDEAAAICRKLENVYPGHPIGLLLKGMSIYWQYYPIISDSPARAEFEDVLHRCMNLCEKYKPEDEAEFLLASLCARGLLLLFYSDNNLSYKLIPLARSSYKYVRKSFNFTQTYSDFYFFTGLYNFYREAYPDAHPFYKSILFIFPHGDRKKGLDELETAFYKSIFLKAEASEFLSSSYKYFENNYQKASFFSKELFRRYPPNNEYRLNCIEDLLLSKKYDEAEKLLSGFQTNSAYYRASLAIFRGVLYEKKYHDMKRAEREYSDGADEIASYGDYGSQYAAYAYFGLSRVSGYFNNVNNKNLYRKKALELTSFNKVNFDN